MESSCRRSSPPRCSDVRTDKYVFFCLWEASASLVGEVLRSLIGSETSPALIPSPWLTQPAGSLEGVGRRLFLVCWREAGGLGAFWDGEPLQVFVAVVMVSACFKIEANESVESNTEPRRASELHNFHVWVRLESVRRSCCSSRGIEENVWNLTSWMVVEPRQHLTENNHHVLKTMQHFRVLNRKMSCLTTSSWNLVN